MSSFESLTEEQLEALWADEVDRRLEELHAGEAEEIPGPEVLREARILLD